MIIDPSDAKALEELVDKINTIGVDEAVSRIQKATALVQYCRKFIHENNITCVEAVYQTNHVIENAYEFIEGVCDILGYKKVDKE